MTANNDSNDLEALFDSIAADYTPAPASTASTPPVEKSTRIATDMGDSEDLEALFDSVSAQSREISSSADDMDQSNADQGSDAWPQQEVVFNRIGQMARALHDTLGQLGYDKLLEKTVSAIPDAKDRLAYVANLTEQAACRVLNATDIAGPLVDQIESESVTLGERWDMVFDNKLGPEDFRALAIETRQFLKEQLPQKAKSTHAQLTEIMMAQDFQDLTGQVIKKIVSLAQDLEYNLMGVLIEVLPEAKRTSEVASLMNGPVVNAEGRSDVVVSQEQVDDLLDSLGF